MYIAKCSNLSALWFWCVLFSCVCVCVCLCFASHCMLCKSLAGASSQTGGQTRKQMDLFGLNPSHAISSSWPSSSNLHVSLQNRRKGAEYVWLGGGELLVPSRESKKTDSTQSETSLCSLSWLTLCVLDCADTWLLPPCWNSWFALFLCCLSSALFPPMVQSAVCSFSQEHFACLSHKCLAFSGIYSHHTLWNPLGLCWLF